MQAWTQNVLDGGQNIGTNGYFNKTNWLMDAQQLFSWGSGQHVGASVSLRTYGVGDSLPLSLRSVCWGGFIAGGDEGCELEDMQAYEGNVEYAGTLTGSPTTGATSVTVSPTQGAGTQGAERYLLNSTAGKTISGTLSAISGSGPISITGSGTSWPVSTMAATLGTNVTAPSSGSGTPVTPTSFTIGSISNITTSTLVCVYDAGAFEMVIPSNVTGSQFTAVFTKPHPSTALIAAGGLCGYAIDLTADDVTNSTFTGLIQTITGTLHFAWPVVLSTSATSAQVWISGQGLYGSYNGQWTATNNSYVLYPMAIVTSVQQSGGVSNTLTLDPNNVAWANGDNVFESLYPAIHVGGGNDVLEKYHPNSSASAGGRWNLYLNGLWVGQDYVLAAKNNTPTSLYTPSGGLFTAPYFIKSVGEYSYGMNFQYAPDAAAILLGCPIAGCNSTATIETSNNSAGFDQFQYDGTNKRYVLTENNRAGSYIFDPSALIFPAGLQGPSASFSVNTSGRVEAQNYKGHTLATLTVGANAGTGATLVCATSYRCSGFSGTLTLTAGTGPSAGTLATLKLSSSYDYIPSCIVASHGTNVVSGLDWSTTNSMGGTLVISGTVSESSVYTLNYICGN